jgi:hypothetical protein
VSEQTLHRWRQQDGCLNADDAKRLRELERENGKLKRMVADQLLEIQSRGAFAVSSGPLSIRTSSGERSRPWMIRSSTLTVRSASMRRPARIASASRVCSSPRAAASGGDRPWSYRTGSTSAHT